MSPALSPSSTNAASSGSGNLPIFPNWNNPLSSYFGLLDGRQHVLQTENNRYLEMHPKGPRGVEHVTEYCLLTSLILNITGLGSYNKSAEVLAGWEHTSSGMGHKYEQARDKATLHVIKAIKTNKFLCMDDQSVIYQTENFSKNHCVFNHNMTLDYYDQFYRQVNKSARKWYVEINKDGTLKCGNVTRHNAKGARFLKTDAKDVALKPSMPFPHPNRKRKCCPKKRCKNNKRDRKPSSRRRKCFKKWCRKKRRQFFQLKLKDLKRYYNRCIKKETNDRIRHCKNR